MKKCSNKDCFVHEGEICAFGEDSHHVCSRWNNNASSEGLKPIDPPSLITGRVPWSSAALGTSDLARLYQQGPSLLVGVLGAENSGKTTFLSAIYLQLLSGRNLDGYDFCGSQSLGAWEAIASFSRFNHYRKASFPPHTPRGVDRTPGILHLALKDKNCSVKNVLFTDSPGEWFSQWAIDAESVDAQGATWTVNQSDVFLIFADSEKLAGPLRGKARGELRMLIERLAESVRDRPVALVWAKSDKPPVESVKTAVQNALSTNIPHAIEFEVSVDSPEGILEATERLLHSSWTPNKAKLMKEPPLRSTPFLAYRGQNELS